MSLRRLVPFQLFAPSPRKRILAEGPGARVSASLADQVGTALAAALLVLAACTPERGSPPSLTEPSFDVEPGAALRLDGDVPDGERDQAIAGVLVDVLNRVSPVLGYRAIFLLAVLFYVAGAVFVSRIRSVR